MHECSFCETNYNESLGGFTVFKRDGTALHYCSKKCLRNAELKRNPRKLKWTSV